MTDLDDIHIICAVFTRNVWRWLIDCKMWSTAAVQRTARDEISSGRTNIRFTAAMTTISATLQRICEFHHSPSSWLPSFHYSMLWHSVKLQSLFHRFLTFLPTSSSRMRVIYHNWSATKQRPHPQSVAEISHHSVLSGDRIRQCELNCLLNWREAVHWIWIICMSVWQRGGQ